MTTYLWMGQLNVPKQQACLMNMQVVNESASSILLVLFLEINFNLKTTNYHQFLFLFKGASLQGE